MDTNHHGREDRPTDTNPDEVHAEHPAKTQKAQHKIDIKESELGREQGQTPADEHIESLSQIDNETKEMHNHKEDFTENNNRSEMQSEESQHSGYMNDTTSADRDTGNNTEGWEDSRTARHK